MDAIEESIEKCKKDENFQDFKVHIGGGVYATIDKNFKKVDFRRFWKPTDEEQPIPTKSGISLTFEEFRLFVSLIPEIETVDAFKNAKLCILSDDHQNQEGALRCFECNPFGDFMN